MKTTIKLVMTSFVLGLMAIAAFAGTTPDEMHISCTAPNPEHQEGLHRPKGDGDIWTFQIVLDGDAHFVTGPYWSYPGKGGSDPDWGLWTGGADGDSSLGWSSPGKTGTFSIRVSGQIACGNGNGGKPIDFSAGWDGDVCPGVQKIQYLDPLNGYVDVTDTLYVLKGTTVTFKAIPDQSNTDFCEGEPHWSGTADPAGDGETTTATFSYESGSLEDYYTVEASAGEGNKVTANVVVYDLIPQLTPEDDFDGRSHDDYGIGENINLSVAAEIGGSPLEVTNSLLGGKNSLKMKTLTAQTLSNDSSWGDLYWSVENGDGDLEDGGAGDGTGTYTVGDSEGSFELSVTLANGPSAGQKRTVTKSQKQPTGVKMFKAYAPGVDLYHTWGTASAGFQAMTCLVPSNVSFSHLQVKESSASPTVTGWLRTQTGSTGGPTVPLTELMHPDGVWQPIGSWPSIGQFGITQSSNSPWLQGAVDNVQMGDFWTGIPLYHTYGVGSFTWNIPLYYSLNGGTAHLFTHNIHYYTTQDTGRSCMQKGGISACLDESAPTQAFTIH